MLNSVIKIDLHIHSSESEYKEPEYQDGLSIVANSKLENIDVLLEKLVEHQIKMFSITDHNRFNAALYRRLSQKLSEDKYQDMGLLYGIEFDVCLEENKKPVHIITIFDVVDETDCSKIETLMDQNKLVSKEQSYPKDQFEKILRDIGLNTILIVHQRTSLDNQEGNHNSLSEGSSDPYKIIKVGYISALEYQKPNVEGIIKNNLSEVNVSIALITGSDCHDWSVYPKHDKNTKNTSLYFSKIKALPTFKGLLLALTSISTRFNRVPRSDTNYIKSFSLKDRDIELDPGINAIIGENGSGKTSLFRILSNNIGTEKYIKDIMNDNGIKCEKSNVTLEVINQSELITKFSKGQLLENQDDLFNKIDTTTFEANYTDYANQLKNAIEDNINRVKKLSALENKYFELEMNYEDASTLYVSISSTKFEPSNSLHTPRREKLAAIINDLLDEYNKSYYNESQKNKIYTALVNIREVYDEVEIKEKQEALEEKIKNLIVKECTDYTKNIQEVSTSEDNEISEYRKRKEAFINDIAVAIRINNKTRNALKDPKICKGETANHKNGYVFSKEAKFNNISVFGEFLEHMVNTKYRKLSNLLEIETKEQFYKAIKGCTKTESIDDCWKTNLEKFLSWAKEEKTYIKEESSDNSIGNTLGEMSLVYYKFQTSDENECDVLMIDQPEDNISNNRIAEKLVKYFNDVRKSRQLIIVTHNPLLVVNLDVDNVIHLNKVNNNIEVKAGCLEDEKNQMLKLVSNTLDGGKEMIEKRLKIYG